MTMDPTRRQAVIAEIREWFFEDYFKRWVAAGSGRSGEPYSFINGYWGSPLHTSHDTFAGFRMTDADVTAYLKAMHERLAAGGYTHTVVPDQRIRVFNPQAAAIEVIWSRRRDDETEVERRAVHFLVSKTEGRWKMVAIEAMEAPTERLDDFWPEQAF